MTPTADTSHPTAEPQGRLAPGVERVAVIGLGYVGLPVALAFARTLPGTVGFDIDAARVAALARGEDATGEVGADDIAASGLTVTANPADLAGATAYIVTVPTPIDGDRQPDLSMVLDACRTVGRHLRPGGLVVFESTVYPGVTRRLCGPALAEASGLEPGRDFHLGYSPERINPGDAEHTLTRITKVVSGEDAATLERVAALYGRIIEAEIHHAPSLEVAEAAKVIENIQRDLNIALMNELALIFQRLGIATRDVLAAAATKWNFHTYTPGLVGGHCIGVDPYYLTARAQQVGYHPEVILAGRRINDTMGRTIGRELVRRLTLADRAPRRARVGVFGLTFKENVRDLRNSRVPDILAELADWGVAAMAHDPIADADTLASAYGLTMADPSRMRDLDALVLAVPHRDYLGDGGTALLDRLAPGGIVMDVKSALDPAAVTGRGFGYWSL